MAGSIKKGRRRRSAVMGRSAIAMRHGLSAADLPQEISREEVFWRVIVPIKFVSHLILGIYWISLCQGCRPATPVPLTRYLLMPALLLRILCELKYGICDIATAKR